MTTMMEHPKHGRHQAIGSEIETMKANGWAICAPKTAAAGPEASPEPVLALQDAPAQRRRGPNKPKAK